MIVFGPLSRNALRGTQRCSLNSTVSFRYKETIQLRSTSQQNQAYPGRVGREETRRDETREGKKKISPAAGNESLPAIPYSSSRSAYEQSTDPLRTAEKRSCVGEWLVCKPFSLQNTAQGLIYCFNLNSTKKCACLFQLPIFLCWVTALI